MKIGFDNEKYIKLQSEKILERIEEFWDKLYLEFGGKLFDDFHASRVLPGFMPDTKIKMLSFLSEKIEIILTISAEDIEKNKIREDIWISYKEEIFRLIKAFSLFNLNKISVVITKFEKTKNVEEFIQKLKNFSIPYFFHYKIENYPYEIEKIVSENGFWKNDFVKTEKPLVVVTWPWPGSWKMAVCLSQLYHENKIWKKAWYSKFETFPVWNLPLNHPVNLAYESATVDLNDVNMIDPFHLENYKEVSVNYNRDIEIFPLLKTIFEEIQEKSPYKSPTDMWVNMVWFCISDPEIVEKYSKNEIIRRYFSIKNDVFFWKSKKESLEKIEIIMQKANISPKDRKIIEIVKQKELEKWTSITAIELDNGEIITWKQSNLMSSWAACIINVLKKLWEINDNISIISPIILETIQNLKIKNESWLNRELNINEVLIAISISAITSPVAEMAMQNLEKLRWLDCHSSKILEKEDLNYLKKLGICVSMESKY